MCGIVGVLRFGDLSKQKTLSSAIYLGTSLLELTEERGKMLLAWQQYLIMECFMVKKWE